MSIYQLAGKQPRLSGEFHFVAENAVVIGDVELGDEVGIWFGTTVRGDTASITIGARTNIQDHCMLHADPGFPLIVGSGCTIGHRVTLHGCTVGDSSLIGMSATILNGAVIGRNCLVGAGSLVTEGKIIPDGSLALGSPAKVVRALTADEIVGLERSAAHYVANARLFAAELRRM